MVAEFNDVKNEHKNLTSMMFVMIRRFKNNLPPPFVQDLGFDPSFPQNETP